MRNLGLVQALIQSELDTDIYLSLIDKALYALIDKFLYALIDKALYGLNPSVRAWYQLVSSTPMECGYEKTSVDQLVVAGDVVAMIVFHVDDIHIAAIEEVAEIEVRALNQRCNTKYIGEVESGMAREYNRGIPGERHVGDMAYPIHPGCTQLFYVSKSGPIPTTSSLGIMHGSEEKPVVLTASPSMADRTTVEIAAGKRQSDIIDRALNNGSEGTSCIEEAICVSDALCGVDDHWRTQL